MKINDVLAAYEGRVSLATRTLSAEGSEESPVVLLEGDSTTLLFLSELFAAVARESDCGFSMDPRGEGSALLGLSIVLCKLRSVHPFNSLRQQGNSMFGLRPSHSLGKGALARGQGRAQRAREAGRLDAGWRVLY